MKLSVVMVTYNHENYIAQAVRSVLAQQTNFDFEIAIGEDCSTDRTREVVTQLAAENPKRIRVLLRKKNMGALPNFCDTYATCQHSEYIALLEGDDYWTDPHKLQKQVDFLSKQQNYSMVFHAVRYFWQDNARPPMRFPKSCPATLPLNDLLNENAIQTCSVVFRRAMLPAFPDWFTSLALGDWPLCVMLATRGPIGFLDEEMAAYRVHQGGVWTGATFAFKYEKVLRMYTCLRDYLGGDFDQVTAKSRTRLHLALADELRRAGDETGAREQFSLALDSYAQAPPDAWGTSQKLCVASHEMLEVLRGNLSEQMQHIMTQRARIAAHESYVASLESQLPVLRTYIKQLEGELTHIKESRCWKIKETLTSLPVLGQMAAALRKSA